MTPVNGNFDEMLRRALHAEVDFIEPADGGLDRIRRRTHAPWLGRHASLMLTECVDLVRLIGIRLEPSFTGARAAVADQGGPRAALINLLSSIVASLAALVMPSRRRGATHRSGPGGTGGVARSNLGWLRPALAVAGAVVIVVAGVFGLAQVRDNLVLELFPGSSSPASTGTGGASSGGQAPTLQGQTAPGIIPPSSSGADSPKPSPSATCSTPTSQQATPSPTPTATTSPSVTPTDTPTPAPTDTTLPTPTDSASTSAVSVGASTGIRTVARAVPASACASPAPSTSAG
jgi:hypothetical protein